MIQDGHLWRGNAPSELADRLVLGALVDHKCQMVEWFFFITWRGWKARILSAKGPEPFSGQVLVIWPVLEGERPVVPFAPSSNLDLLGDAQRIFQLDAQVSHRAIDLRMTKQKLDGAQISCLAVDLRCSGSPLS